MDVFETFELQDAPYLATSLAEEGTILFSYTRDRKIVYNLMLSNDFLQAGRLHWSGDTAGCTLVGCIGYGLFWFRLEEEVYPANVAKRLNVSRRDAKVIAELLNTITPQAKRVDSAKRDTIPRLETPVLICK